MSKAADGLTTATEHVKPSRRRALSILATAAPTLAMAGSALAVTASHGKSEIASLYVEWLAQRRRLTAAIDTLNAAEDRSSAICPPLPEILAWKNAPFHWQVRVSSKYPYMGEFDRDWRISLRLAQEISSGVWAKPDKWAAEVLEAATQYEAVTEAADEMAGVPAANSEYENSFHAVKSLANHLVDIAPTDLADVQMQIRATQDQHEDETTGPLEEKLFAAILSASSAFDRRAV